MPKIFISYRRKDSSYVSDRIYDILADHFGKENILKDIDNIRPGIDFRSEIARMLNECDVVLAVIGPQWVGADNATNTRRIDQENDSVRVEISYVLRRNIPIIPILVDGMTMEKLTNLPQDIAAVVYRNGFEVRADPYFRSDAELVVRRIKEEFQAKTIHGQRLAPARSAPQRRAPARPVVTAAIIAAVLLIVASGALLARGPLTQLFTGGQSSTSATATPTPIPTATTTTSPKTTTITVMIVTPTDGSTVVQNAVTQFMGTAVNPNTGQSLSLPHDDFTWTLVSVGTPIAAAATPVTIAQGAQPATSINLPTGDYTLTLSVSDAALHYAGSTSITIYVEASIT